MPSYNFYVSDKTEPELVEAFNKMKAEGILSEFIQESCAANLPLFLERKIAETKTQMKYFECLKEHYNSAKEIINTKKDSKKNDYLKVVPKNRSFKELMGWLTSPLNIKNWQAAGFKSAQEVVDALEKQKEEKKGMK